MAFARCLRCSGFVLLAVVSCKGRSPLTLHDTEGRVFEARCEGELSTCALEQRTGPRAAAPSQLRARGRYVGVCESDHDADCRALVCSNDAECPPPGRAPQGSCVGGHCIDPTHDIASSDAVMLCLAGTGLGHEEARQVERYALGLNCGAPCRVPKPCER